MKVFSKITIYTGIAGMGILSLLMLISAVLMAFTQEVPGGTKAGYIALPLLIFLSMVFALLFPTIRSFQK